jgi:hypothetical protein
MMAALPTHTRVDSEKALAFWREYQQSHDVSDRIGQAVGIDPENCEVHFGSSAADVAKRLIQEGRFRPLYFLRVGFPHYAKKVGAWRSKGK